MHSTAFSTSLRCGILPYGQNGIQMGPVCQRDKRQFGEEEFDKEIGAKYRWLQLEVMEFDTFAVRVYLAAPKLEAPTA